MIRKSLKVSGILIMAAVLLCGCTLANPKQEMSARTGDQLIGVFVTTEDLKESYSGRIKGEIATDEKNLVIEMDFGGIKGMGCYVLSVGDDEKLLNYSYSNEGFSKTTIGAGTELTIDTKVYYDPAVKQQFFLNPVYKTPKGNAYIAVSNRIELPRIFSDGGGFGYPLSNNTALALGGKKDIRLVEIMIWFEPMPRVKEITIRQYDKNGNLLSSKAADMEDMLKQEEWIVKKEKDMDYAVVESTTAKGKIYNTTEEESGAITVYVPNKDGIAIEKWILFE